MQGLITSYSLPPRYVASWIDQREVQSEKANLVILFEKYVPPLLDVMRSGRFKKITPVQVGEHSTYILCHTILQTIANLPQTVWCSKRLVRSCSCIVMHDLIFVNVVSVTNKQQTNK